MRIEYEIDALLLFSQTLVYMAKSPADHTDALACTFEEEAKNK